MDHNLYGKMDVEEQLVLINEKLDRIESILETYVKPSCNEMHTHIQFINSVYDAIKTPLFYASNKIKSFIPSTTEVIDYNSSLLKERS